MYVGLENILWSGSFVLNAKPVILTGDRVKYVGSLTSGFSPLQAPLR